MCELRVDGGEPKMYDELSVSLEMCGDLHHDWHGRVCVNPGIDRITRPINRLLIRCAWAGTAAAEAAFYDSWWAPGSFA
jgi:hypothetical protein